MYLSLQIFSPIYLVGFSFYIMQKLLVWVFVYFVLFLVYSFLYLWIFGKSIPRNLFYSKTFRILLVFNLLVISFCVCYKISFKVHIFESGHPVFPTQFVNETILLLCVLGKLGEYQLTTEIAWIYFWPLCSVQLAYASIL
jgi:hypothetical protein